MRGRSPLGPGRRGPSTRREGSTMSNLAQHLLATAEKYGERPALRMDDASLTYDEFRDVAGQGAAAPRPAGAEGGHRPALRVADAARPGGGARDVAGQVAAGLRARGVEPGDRVGMV